MSDCVFCKIAQKEFDLAKIWENDDFLAILDIAPVVKGMTVVMPKQHYSSKPTEMPKNIYQGLTLAARKTAKILKKGLNAQRVFMIIEGLEINHAHIKLFPVTSEHLNDLLSNAGSVKTKNLDKLKQLAQEINKNI